MWKMAFVLLFAASLASCQISSSDGSAADGSSLPQKITVAYTSQPQSTLVHIALAKGYFSEERLAVESLMHTYGKAALQSVLERKADFATVAETPIMFSVLKGEKIFVIANIEASNTNNAIVARKNAHIATPGDLKGKRVGFTPGTTSDFFLDSLLTANGLTRGEITPVALKPEAMQEALVSGQVDAVSTWNYQLALIRHHLGTQGIILYDRGIYTETFNIAVLQDYAQNNPETLKRFLRALIKAENFVSGNPDEAQAIISARTDIDRAVIREVWDAFNYSVVLDQSLQITLEDETRWAIKNKLTEQTAMPDYASYIHGASLQAVKPDALRRNR